MSTSDQNTALTVARRAVWDTGLSPEEFLAVLRGESTPDWPSRAFCVARLLECANWYDVARIMAPRDICAVWPEVRAHVRSDSIRRGMEYVCRVLQ